jgi:hypothetical protein
MDMDMDMDMGAVEARHNKSATTSFMLLATN